MRPEVHDALATSTLTEDRKRVIREKFDQPTWKRAPADRFMAALMLDVAEAEHAQAVWFQSPRYLAWQALDAAFYGTLTPRENSERPGRAKNGWRDRQSHPFEYAGKTYDLVAVEELSDDPADYEFGEADLRFPTLADAIDFARRKALGEAQDRTVRQYNRLHALIEQQESAT